MDVKFKVLNYHPTDLKKLMETMTAVERDLKSGNYQSALRRREVVLGTLDSLKTYAQGEFEVRRDQSANLPEQIQRELLHGMQDVSPRGWETLNRKYFERLSTEETKK